MALGIGEGDEVLVPAFTWVATANVVLYCGAKPVFVDIDCETFNVNPSLVKDKITSKTKACIAVHLFGLCADMDAIQDALGEIPIIEDAACAAGAEYKGNSAGALGLLGCFSFHPRKAITTGEGGMITTNDDDLAEKIACMRNHGAAISEEQRHHGAQPYILPDFNLLGFNYRMTDLQGAVGCVQIKKLDKFKSERNKWANYYIQELSEIKWLRLPKIDSNYGNGWQSFVCFVDENLAPFSRNEIMKILQDAGVSTRPGTHAVHMLNFYKEKYSINPSDFPEAKAANDCSMAIPLHNRMTKDDFEYVVNALKAL